MKVWGDCVKCKQTTNAIYKKTSSAIYLSFCFWLFYPLVFVFRRGEVWLSRERAAG